MDTAACPLVLAVDKGGRPTEWITWRSAANYYAGGSVLWTVGEPAIILHGGLDQSGHQSTLALHPVIALTGTDARRYECAPVALSNPTLFARDHHTCLYCGQEYGAEALSRDHVVPRARGGTDTWCNVVTACRPCNRRKGCHTPAQAGMALLALPFAPSYIEALILANRRILADQMAFLMTQKPNKTARAS